MIDFFISAVTIGSLFAIIAVGFTLIFGVGNVLNMAHGAMITSGAFAAYLTVQQGQGVWTGLVVAVIWSGILGAVLYLGVVRPIQDRPVVVLILTFMVGIGVEHVYRLGVSGQEQVIPPLLDGATTVAGSGIDHFNIFIVAFSWLLIAALLYSVRSTRIGLAIQATSMTEKGSRLVGIDTARINLYTFILSSMLAGIAGVIIAGQRVVLWNMGTEPLILSFAIVILGGLGSIKGSILAAYVIGFLEVTTTTFIDPQMTGFTPMLLIILILLVRPEGIYGKETTST